jgi:hypothetical protein
MTNVVHGPADFPFLEGFFDPFTYHPASSYPSPQKATRTHDISESFGLYMQLPDLELPSSDARFGVVPTLVHAIDRLHNAQSSLP